MTKGGISRRIVNFANCLVGNVRGGMSLALVLACAFFAALSGSAPATVIAIGTMLYNDMVKLGYPGDRTAGLLVVSGGLGPIIPPSIIMVIYCTLTGASVGNMFKQGMLIGIVIMLALARHLNILVLGETEAKAVGMPVLPFRMGLLFVAAMTTATSVCVSGNIGFVGLVVPHMMRMIVGPDHRVLLPASALAGAAFLVICDSLGRIIIPPAEVRVGIMTALLGTPYFLYLLRRMQKQVF